MKVKLLATVLLSAGVLAPLALQAHDGRGPGHGRGHARDSLPQAGAARAVRRRSRLLQ